MSLREAGWWIFTIPIRRHPSCWIFPAGLTGTYGGSYTSTTGIQTGDVRMYVWPEITAENAAVTAVDIHG